MVFQVTLMVLLWIILIYTQVSENFKNQNKVQVTWGSHQSISSEIFFSNEFSSTFTFTNSSFESSSFSGFENFPWVDKQSSYPDESKPPFRAWFKHNLIILGEFIVVRGNFVKIEAISIDNLWWPTRKSWNKMMHSLNGNIEYDTDWYEWGDEEYEEPSISHDKVEMKYPEGVTEIPPSIDLTDSKFKINKNNQTVEFSFPNQHRNLSTIFGGDGDGKVVLTRNQMATFPHDFVLSSISPLTPTSILENCTPDVTFKDEAGTFRVLELTTRSRLSDEIAASAFQEKMSRYEILMPYCSSFNVLVVSHSHSLDMMGLVNDINLSKNYSFAVSLVSKFSFECNLSINDNATKINFDEVLTSMGKFKIPVYNEIEDFGGINYEKTTYEKTIVEDFDSYIARLSKVDSRDETGKSVVHVPFYLVPPKSTSTIPFMHGEDIYSRICQFVSQMDEEEPTNFDQLMNQSYISQGQKKSLGDSDGKNDFHKFYLNESDKVLLSLRGVLAKKNVNNLNEEKKLFNKKPVSFDTDDSDIDFWLQKPMTINQEPPDSDYVKWSSSGGFNLIDLWREFSSSDLLVSARFLESVFNELIYNCKRKCQSDNLGLIIRPVQGFDAFVIIHNTTTYSFDEHIFYMVIFRSEVDQPSIFEHYHPIGNNWSHTKFMSTSLRRIENCQNLSNNLWSLACLDVEQFVKSISFDSSIDDFDSIYRLVKWQCLMILDDNKQLAAAMSNLRYYFMSLISNPNNPERSCKVISKLPDMVRGRLTKYFIQQWSNAHSRILRVKLSDIGIDLLKSLNITDSTTFEELAGRVDHLDPLLSEPIPTFCGVTVTSMSQILTLSYFHVLKNKNTGSGLVDEYKIFEKMLSNAYSYIESGMSKKGFNEHVTTDSKQEVSNLKKYMVSGSAIKKGCELTKETICEHNGWKIGEYDEKMTYSCIDFLLKTLIEDLATTKSSSEDFNVRVVSPDVEGKWDPKGDDRLGKRKRAYELMYGLSFKMKDPMLAKNIDIIIEEFNEKGGIIKTTTFWKAQNTGPRDIYVLTMESRLIIRLYSDIHRNICSHHPSEKLTDPKSRDDFQSQHFRKCKNVRDKGRFSSTLSVSADMSTWSQKFTMYEFECMDRHLLPPCFVGFSHFVLDAHRRKIVELSPPVVKSFFRTKSKIEHHGSLSSDSVDRLRNGFWTGDELIEHQTNAFPLKNDMLTGILHYPSSSYHVVQLEVVKFETMKWIESRGLKCVFSFEVSSDDEGIKISVFSDNKDQLRRELKLFKKAWPLIKSNIDKCFGITTSDEKTSTSLLSIFEFNSEFHAMGTVVSALVKWVSRANDDNLSDSLHKRISSLMSQLSQVRDQGATGFLCHAIQIGQCSSLCRSLGYTTMTWGTFDVFKSLMESKLSYVGFFQINNPRTSGLVDTDYNNWNVCKGNSDSRKIMFKMGTFVSMDDEDQSIKTTYSVRSLEKHNQILDRLDIDREERETLVNEGNFEVFLRNSHSVEESQLKIRRLILNPNTSSNLTWVTRSHSNMQTPYLLWAALYRSDQELISLKDVIERCKLIQDVEISLLFPMWEQFEVVKQESEMNIRVVKRTKPLRTRVQWVRPYYNSEEWCSDFKQLCRHFWFGSKLNMSRSRAEVHWEMAKRIIPFLKDSHSSTLESSPMESYEELLTFINQISRKTKSRRLLVRGKVERFSSSIGSLMTHNLASDLVVEFDEEDLLIFEPSGTVSSNLRRVVDSMNSRVSTWLEILPSMYEHNYERFFKEMKADLAAMMVQIPESSRNMSTGDVYLDDFYERILFLLGLRELSTAIVNSSHFAVYYSPQNCDNNKYSGDYDMFLKRSGISMRILKDRSTCTLISSEISSVSPRLCSPYVYNNLEVGQVQTPTGMCYGLKKEKGQIYLTTDTGWFVALPKMTQSKKTKKNGEGFLQCWLSGSEFNEDEATEFATIIQDKRPPPSLNSGPGFTQNDYDYDIAKSMLSTTKRRFKKISTLPLREAAEKSVGLIEKIQDEDEEEEMGNIFNMLQQAYGDEAEDSDLDDIFEFEDEIREDEVFFGEIEAEGLDSFTWLQENACSLEIYKMYLSSTRTKVRIYRALELEKLWDSLS